jgi:putative glutamine transport system substrate-binding protein
VVVFRLRLALVALLVAAPALAGEKLDEIRARGRLIVSVKNDAARPHKDPAHAQKRGFELELVRALARRLVGDERKVELRVLARPARLPMLGAGGVDLVVSMIPVNATTAAQFALSHPYFVGGVSLMAKKDAPYTGLDGLASQTVALLKQGFNDYGVELQRIAAHRRIPLTTRYFPTFDDAAGAVIAGEAAAMVSNLVDLDAYLRTHDGFRLVGEPLEPRPCAVAMQKGDAELLGAVNETIDRLKQSGELKRMAERWQLPYRL